MTRKQIEERIAQLPSGGITKKKIKNKATGTVYEYDVYQWREDGKQKSMYLSEDALEYYSSQIDERKNLEKILKNEEVIRREGGYKTNVIVGDKLIEFAKSAKGYKKREIFSRLEAYVNSERQEKVLILYGLRRTGKTTMIKQVINDFTEEQIKKAAFIQCSSTDNLGALNKDLNRLQSEKYEYIFIDEITLCFDFVEGAALLSDIFVAMGMKIVLSGTDSLGFWLTKGNELYDRCILLHTTFIPYREFENVLGIKGIDKYIEYGGTMSFDGNHYNKTFGDKAALDEYIDSAIAFNIQHSLEFFRYGGHFRSLYDLYEKRELTSAINRVVEDMNHRFTVDVITRDFKSNDFALSAKNLRNDKRKRDTTLDAIDIAKFTERLKDLLSIKNRNEMKVQIEPIHEIHIKEYLVALDLIRDFKTAFWEKYGEYANRTIFTQPGLRYSQAKALIKALSQDVVFKELSNIEKDFLQNRILSEIKGRMLEDIIILETAMANPQKDIVKFAFADGEFDMVACDPETLSCDIYEVKHSNVRDKDQIRHLIDEDKCSKAEFRYGKIMSKNVIYMGENITEQGINYINAEDYLLNLKGANL